MLASIAALILTVVLSVLFWRILPLFILTSFAKGFLIAFEIFVIIFGAVFFLEVLKSVGVIGNIGYYLEGFSKDYRIQVILLAWFFENFLEGTAGFGTPCAVVAPILISLGISPISAVVISLLGNSTAGVFGAAGTPIRIGFAGLNTTLVPTYAVLINILGFLVPVFILWALAAEQKEKGHFWEGVPFAVWAGIAFVVPSVIFVFLGQEFTSILAAIVGVFLVFLTTRLKLFLPKNIRVLGKTGEKKVNLSLFKTLFPYGLLIALLMVGKFWLATAGITFSFAKHTVSLFNPGLAFIIAGLPVAVFWGGSKGLAWSKMKLGFKKALGPFVVIACMSTLVQLMINSGQNFSGFPSLLQVIARSFETKFLPFWSPFIGAFGSFLTGSVTISNIMFGNFLSIASRVLNIDAAKILALELVGAAAGNMIALADMLAAEAVVGLQHKERQILKRVILPCIIYVFLTGLFGVLIVNFF